MHPHPASASTSASASGCIRKNPNCPIRHPDADACSVKIWTNNYFFSRFSNRLILFQIFFCINDEVIMTHRNRNIIQKFRKNNFKKKNEKNRKKSIIFSKNGVMKIYPHPASASASTSASGLLKIRMHPHPDAWPQVGCISNSGWPYFRSQFIQIRTIPSNLNKLRPKKKVTETKPPKMQSPKIIDCSWKSEKWKI